MLEHGNLTREIKTVLLWESSVGKEVQLEVFFTLLFIGRNQKSSPHQVFLYYRQIVQFLMCKLHQRVYYSHRNKQLQAYL